MHVDVEAASPLCAGLVVADVWGTSPLPKNVYMAEVSYALQLAAAQSSFLLHPDQRVGCLNRAWTWEASGP